MTLHHIEILGRGNSGYLNPYLSNIPILQPLKTKTPENLWFSGVFRGYKMGKLARNELNSVTLSNLTAWISEHTKAAGLLFHGRKDAQYDWSIAQIE